MANIEYSLSVKKEDLVLDITNRMGGLGTGHIDVSVQERYRFALLAVEELIKRGDRELYESLIERCVKIAENMYHNKDKAVKTKI